MPGDDEFGLSLTPPHPSRLGANLPEDAIHPLNLADGAGKSLDRVIASPFISTTGTSRPSTHSISHLYDAEGLQVPNSLNRFAVSSWMPYKYNAGASLSFVHAEREPRRRHGMELASRAEGRGQSDDAVQ
jgi:hypothetical protein